MDWNYNSIFVVSLCIGAVCVIKQLLEVAKIGLIESDTQTWPQMIPTCFIHCMWSRA